MPLEVKVESLCLGTSGSGVVKTACQQLRVELDGIVGDRHRGFSKPADGRDTGLARGTAIRNWRQWSAVSLEELKTVAERLGIESLEPALLGANITFSGVSGFTQVPRGSKIWFPRGAVFTVEDENSPCIGPGKEIARVFPQVRPADFPLAAQHLRGLVGVVHKAGEIWVGDLARIELSA
jgi:hypothetical protein